MKFCSLQTTVLSGSLLCLVYLMNEIVLLKVPLPEIHTSPIQAYIPAPVEDYVIKNAAHLGYDTKGDHNAPGCTIFQDKNASDIYDNLQVYLEELQEYGELMKNFSSVPDVRLHQDRSICDSLEMHPEGLMGIFKSQQLSYTKAGFLEPLLPPLRHPLFCLGRGDLFMSLKYLVHDFAHMCRSLQQHSQIVLIDMGASLNFHGVDDQPAVYLTQIYKKFGMPFDHIYAYEITPQNLATICELVPNSLKTAYHWINVGVDPTEGASMNPFTMLLSKFTSEDLIIVKLDVDTPAVEIPLAYQLLKNTKLGNLVDHFYFEHHVHLTELAPNWKRSMRGSVKDSLYLFSELRQTGIAAHYWP